MTNVIDVLEERGFIDAMTSEDLREMTQKPLKVYCGFDPTGDSLHLGSLVAIMGLAWFQRFGHTPVAVVGGATGMIGDPSGKSAERQLLNAETIEHNLKGIRKNLEAVLCVEQAATKPIILNNYDWFQKFSFIDFLRDVGKFFRVGPMLAKDSVRARLNSEEGMSFTEFSYQLLQGYDFLYLYQKHQVAVQLGGSDQWGNITAGTDLIKKVTGESGFGITFPLLTRSDGQKFGKTEKGAIWLSPEKLSPYEFYQYLVRVADADVLLLMRLITFMDMEEIRHYEAIMQRSDYVPNTAQKRLAEEVTRIVHGENGLETALRVTAGAAPGSDTTLNAEVLETLARDMPSHTVTSADLLESKLIDIIAKIGLQPSKGEARRLIRNGGVYVNNTQIKDENHSLSAQDIIEGRLVLLAVGKKNKVLLRVEK
ncbi:MAG: tyrosine--tRNA ligase [Parachlamydiaceae bacterium]|nr:tyrosine--tRNA ligase [Parachlamydiaceae bacterium]